MALTAVGIAKDATLQAIQEGFPNSDVRFDWQTVGSGTTLQNKPLYIGVAPFGTPTNSATWGIQKFEFILGPDGVNYVPQVIYTATGTWDGRVALFPN